MSLSKRMMEEQQRIDSACFSMYDIGEQDQILKNRAIAALVEGDWHCAECDETDCDLFLCQMDGPPRLLCGHCHGILHAKIFDHEGDEFAFDPVQHELEMKSEEERTEAEYQEFLKDEIRRKSYP